MQIVWHIFLQKKKKIHYMWGILIVREVCNPLWCIFAAHFLRDLFEDLQELDCFTVSLLTVMLLSP